MASIRIPIDVVGLNDLKQLDRQFKKTGDTGKRAFKKTESAAARLRVKTVGLTASIGALRNKLLVFGFATAGAVTFLKKAITESINLEEATNKSIVTFGEFNDIITTFAETSTNVFAIAKQDAIEYSATLGVILQTSGVAAEASANMSVKLVKLAADMASFNNIPIDVALQKIRSGLVGEIEPLRTVGVLLDEFSTKNKAMELGLAETASSLTQADKVLARYELILEQTSKQQGDMERTGGSLSNQLKKLEANASTLAAIIGKELNPKLNRFVQLANKASQPDSGLAKMVKNAQELGTAFSKINPLVGFYLDFLEDLEPKQKKGNEATREFLEIISELDKKLAKPIAPGVPFVSSQIDGLVENISQAEQEALKSIGIIATTFTNLGDGIEEDILPPMEQTVGAIDRIGSASEKWAENQKAINNLIPEVPKNIKIVNQEMEDARRLGQQFANTLAQAALFGKDLESTFLSIASSFLSFGIGKLFNPTPTPVPGFAHGISFAPGGLSIVGERGPELVNLPRGSQVIPNNIINNDNTNNQKNNISLNFPNVKTLDRFILENEIMPQITEILSEGGVL